MSGRVYGTTTTILSNYALKILTYLRASFSTLLTYFDMTYSLDYEDARYNV